MVRAVLLDALGTLVELPAPWPALVEELAARGVVIDEEQARAALRAEMAYYRAHHDEATGMAELDDLRDRCTEVLRAALPERARSAADLRGALLASLRFRAYPEVPGVLDELRELGVARVVVSNWDVSLRAVLDETGLAPLLDGLVISAEVGASKPDPAIFARALAVAGVSAGEALHVGDTAAADLAGARAAGIRALHLDRSGADGDALASLAELPGLVRSTVP
ncbi:MAG TPA: HAD-IA family hydrolase [Solirubrobacteraceae bacterium]|nr:HAD-IA family hydrolase [Solirubrobacteraceae bacterium]